VNARIATIDAAAAAEIIAEINAIRSSLQGDVTDAQAGLIMHLTRDAMFDCEFDDNPIVEMIWGDSRVMEISKADAGRFISYFGEKDEDGWKVKNVRAMAGLHRAWTQSKGQLSFF